MGLRDMLTDRMDIQAPKTPGKDGASAPTQDWATVAESVPAQITPMSAGQRITAAMAGMAITHKILCVRDGIRQGQRVRDRESGVTIRVTGISRIPARGGIERHYLLDGEEVKDGAP